MGKIKITTIEDLQKMHWYTFELFCADLLLNAGYKNPRITSKGIKGGDDGIDLIAEKGGETILGQCKRWTKNHTLINPIRELGGSLKKRNLEQGVFFVSIVANEYERKEADAYGIKLWDANDIIDEASGYHERMKKRPLLLKIWHGFLWLLKGILKEFFMLIGDFLAEPAPKRYKRRYNKRRY